MDKMGHFEMEILGLDAVENSFVWKRKERWGVEFEEHMRKLFERREETMEMAAWLLRGYWDQVIKNLL